jgi:ribokinase
MSTVVGREEVGRAEVGRDEAGRAEVGRVVVVGSVNVDLVMRMPRIPGAGETVLGGAAERHQGGKGANQAVAAARAGGQVYLLGAVGSDDGQESLDALIAEHVDVAHVMRGNRPTGLAVVLVDEQTGENQIAVAAGANELVTGEDVAQSLESMRLKPADVVVLSFELPVEPLREAANCAISVGARLVVNPAPAQPGYADLLSGAVVTPNMPELAALTASGDLAARAELAAHMPPRSAAIALALRTGGPVVVTMGADGVLLSEGESAEHFPGHGVEVVDTTGAGDTFTGVLAASLAQGHELRACVRRAVAAAALSVTAGGARAGMPTSPVIEDMLSSS